MPARLTVAQTVAKLFRLGGGLNLVDPHITLPPGALTFSKNVECQVNGGYKRCDGYERKDGRARPSDATYTVLNFQLGGNRPIIKTDTVVGMVSGAMAVVCATPVLDSGSWLDTTATGNMPVLVLSGAFVNGEGLMVGVSQLAILKPVSAAVAQSIGDSYYKEALRYAQGVRRTAIQKVPGEGATLGVFSIGDTVYAFKNAVGSASAAMFKSTAGGWVAIPMLQSATFTTGAVSVAEGQVITRAGQTATIRKVIIASGSVGAGTAAGTIWFTVPTGAFTAGAASTSGGGTLTLTSGNVVYSLLPSGAYEFVYYNFGGATASKRVYGCDGVNKGFEFDPTTDAFVPITTGMTLDAPNHVAAHVNYLFFSFKSSLQWSGAGTPFSWSPLLGATEVAMGADVTAILPTRGQVLAVMCGDSFAILYGSGPTSWQLKKFAVGMGAARRCLLELQGQSFFFDNRGVFILEAVQQFGDFAPNAVSKNVKPLIDPTVRQPTCSIVSKNKSQYRMYFNDNLAMCGTFYGGKLIGWTTLTTEHQFVCSWTGEDTIGNEVIYAGTSDGYVMQLDIGTSFDGTAIESIMRLPFSYFGQSEHKKRFRKLVLEIQTQFPIELTVATEYNYGAAQVSGNYTTQAANSGGYWDQAIWNEFFWDGAVISAPYVNIAGVGKNIGLLFRHSDDIDPPYTIEAVQVQYSVWGQSR